MPSDKRREAHDQQKNARIASRSFWAIVLLLAIITIGSAVVGSLRSTEPSSPASVDATPTTLETLLSDTAILSDAALAAREAVQPDIDGLLDTAYGPAYDAIPAYADFHYSVLGEYVELTEVALGRMGQALSERLFDGFEARLMKAASDIDQRYVEEYQRNLRVQIRDHLSTKDISLPLDKAIDKVLQDTVLQDAIARAKMTLPLATGAAGIVGSGSLKVISATIAKKLAAKIAVKASAKGVGVLAGAGSGILLCSWSGPVAAVCGIAGGAAAWFLTDAAVVNIDEFFNREEFEAELRMLLDEDRAKKHDFLTALLAEKAAHMDSAMSKDFRMRDLSSDN